MNLKTISTSFTIFAVVASLNILNITYAEAGERPQLNDLESLKIRVDEKVLKVDVHYPNYRMGGGTPPSRALVDCLMLDILDSDNESTMELKRTIAHQVSVRQGHGADLSQFTELAAQEKGENIVFKLLPYNFYVTTLAVVAKDGSALKTTLDELMPPTRGSNYPAQVNLLYIRGCRL